MEPAVNVEIAAGRIQKIVAREHGNCVCNILRRTPACDGKRTVRDELIVFPGNRAGHVRGDDARTDLIDQYAFSGQPVGKQRRQHGDACLGHTVFTPADAGYLRRAGGDIDDRAALFADGLLTEHLLCRCLRQKQVALCVCTDHAVEALLRHLQQISAHLRRDARVIDKHVDTAKLSDRFFDQMQSAVMVCDIAADIAPFDTVRSQPCQRLFIFFLRSGR